MTDKQCCKWLIAQFTYINKYVSEFNSSHFNGKFSKFPNLILKLKEYDGSIPLEKFINFNEYFPIDFF